MRWPLRNQILVPMGAVMVVTVVGISLLNVLMAVRRTRGQIEVQLRDVSRTLIQSQFPLTDSVLRQMRGLSGAEYALVDGDRVLASSSSEIDTARLPRQASIGSAEDVALGDAVSVDERRYFHCVLKLPATATYRGDSLLHILYPEHSYREAVKLAILPSIVGGGLGIVLVIVAGVWIASRAARPIRQLRGQVGQIARGNFQPVPLPARHDEIRELAEAVNHMVVMLSQYEDEVRRTEQLRTLGQLGGGIAHQMRNYVTGCRMALDLHRQQCPINRESESLNVAARQLALTEKQLQRFLASKDSQTKPHGDVELAELIELVLPLIRPAAEHVGVLVRWQPPECSFVVRGDADALEQLLLNLLLNAIDAAAEASVQDDDAKHPSVGVELRAVAGDRIRLAVIDTGPGPPPDVRERLFEPLVTQKPDGTGLGLSVAREIAEQHGGTINWQRADGTTCFYVELPLLKTEKRSVETARR